MTGIFISAILCSLSNIKGSNLKEHKPKAMWLTRVSSLTVSFLHMPSGSNVLLLVVKSKVSLLYLEELENSVLRVTPALEFEVSTDQLANVMLGELRYNILLSVEAV